MSARAFEQAQELQRARRFDEAIAILRELVRHAPEDGRAILALGSLLHARGALDEAARLYTHLVEQSPADAALCGRLGDLERARGDSESAVAWFTRAAELQPARWEPRCALGQALQEAGRPAAAVAVLREAEALDPTHAEIHFFLGVAYAALGALEDAAAAYGEALRWDPDLAEASNNLGAVCKLLGRLDAAVSAFQDAQRRRPDWVQPLVNLAGVYEWQARHDEARESYRRAIEQAPRDADVHSRALFASLFDPAADADAQRRQHAEWSERHADPLKPRGPLHLHDPSPERRLRVGYVCGLFRDHVLGRYLLPLLREHDRSQIEVICYSNNRIDDDVTDRFRELATTWRDVAGRPDVQVASLIREDRIDVLVDTSLHMEGNRLLVFARQPAPVQVTFAGYPGSTGIAAIDYRLTDIHLDPPGRHDDRYAEVSWRLPQTFWCYDPLGLELAVAPLPADNIGVITFGCLNNFAKINDGVLGMWAEVLLAVPQSRLLLLAHEGSHRAWAIDTLGRRGIEAPRIAFAGYRSRERYLELFNEVDISLDTVPYNGHTTSLDSLWMGVPVVTLVGTTVVGRAGLCQLANLGLQELIAYTPQDYVAIAAGLATDRVRLGELRSSLRQRIERSALMDATAFARNVEAAFRQMWRLRCAGGPRN